MAFMEACKDAIGSTVLIGDTVVYSDSAGETSSLKSGEITGFTAKKIRIKVLKSAWKLKDDGDDFEEILKFPEQIAKV